MMLVATCASPTARTRSVARPCGLRIISETVCVSSKNASPIDSVRVQIGDLGEFLVKGRKRRKDAQQGVCRDRLHDSPFLEHRHLLSICYGICQCIGKPRTQSSDIHRRSETGHFLARAVSQTNAPVPFSFRGGVDGSHCRRCGVRLRCQRTADMIMEGGTLGLGRRFNGLDGDDGDGPATADDFARR